MEPCGNLIILWPGHLLKLKLGSSLISLPGSSSSRQDIGRSIHWRCESATRWLMVQLWSGEWIRAIHGQLWCPRTVLRASRSCYFGASSSKDGIQEAWSEVIRPIYRGPLHRARGQIFCSMPKYARYLRSSTWGCLSSSQVPRLQSLPAGIGLIW